MHPAPSPVGLLGREAAGLVQRAKSQQHAWDFGCTTISTSGWPWCQIVPCHLPYPPQADIMLLMK